MVAAVAIEAARIFAPAALSVTLVRGDGVAGLAKSAGVETAFFMIVPSKT